MSDTATAPGDHWSVLRNGTVIPAHVLALDSTRQVDRRHQRALTRYYLDAGAGGVAVGVHTTQFAIRECGLYAPVLELAAETALEWRQGGTPPVLVAGVAGKTQQALEEARIAHALGYHCALVNVASFPDAPEEEVLDHCRAVAKVMPIIGFSLLREVGGRRLSWDFWRRFAAIPEVVAIKLAPFNRYHTHDVIRGVVDARAEERITLYTGNDDHIVLDLTIPWDIPRDGEMVRVRMQGGLLGHWSVWTKRAVELLHRIHAERDAPTADLLALDSRVTDCNNAIYDGWNDLQGAIPGCHYVLHRQGLMAHTHCLNQDEQLSPGQRENIERVYRDHRDLHDDSFVQENLNTWLED